MPKITLFQVKTIEYKDVDHLKLLIFRHKEYLKKHTMDLDAPGTIAIIQAISYNLIHLTRELECRGGKHADLYALSGGDQTGQMH